MLFMLTDRGPWYQGEVLLCTDMFTTYRARYGPRSRRIRYIWNVGPRADLYIVVCPD